MDKNARGIAKIEREKQQQNVNKRENCQFSCEKYTYNRQLEFQSTNFVVLTRVNAMLTQVKCASLQSPIVNKTTSNSVSDFLIYDFTQNLRFS